MNNKNRFSSNSYIIKVKRFNTQMPNTNISMLHVILFPLLFILLLPYYKFYMNLDSKQTLVW